MTTCSTALLTSDLGRPKRRWDVNINVHIKFELLMALGTAVTPYSQADGFGRFGTESCLRVQSGRDRPSHSAVLKSIFLLSSIPH